MTDSNSWQLALIRSRLGALERKARQPHADAPRLLAECVRELRSTVEVIDAASERLRLVDGDLKRASADVIHGHDRFRALLDLLADAFLATDLSGVILEANAAAGRLLNVSQRALPGRALHVFLNGERVEFLRFLRSLPDNPDQPEREIGLRPRERQFVRTRARVAVSRDSEGLPLTLQWIFRLVNADEPVLPLEELPAYATMPD